MIHGREIKGYHWKVFQHGHTGWWWTDGRGVVSRCAYATKESAASDMEKARSE